MRVLILSCDTGGGHNSCAAAIRQIFAENGHYCDVADALSFVSNKLSKLMSWGHTTMYRHVPGLFRAGYEFSEKNPSILEDDTIVYKLLTGGTEQLHDYLKSGEYDTVICAHVFSGLLLRQTMKEYPMQLITAFVATDYTCSPGAANSDLDYYFIPSASLVEDFVSQGVAKEKIIPTGIPVRQEFYGLGNKAEAKRKLGIDPNHPHLLMMCGSMGCGPLKKLTKLLQGQMDSEMELSVVCGTNENLRAELTEHFGAEKIFIFMALCTI